MLWELNEEPGPSWEGMGAALQDRKGDGSRVLQPRGCLVPPSSPMFWVFLLAGPLLHKMAKSSKESREQIAWWKPRGKEMPVLLLWFFQPCFPY